MSKSVKESLAGYQRRLSERQPYLSPFQECFDYLLPRKADITHLHGPGQKRQDPMLYDSTGVQANELFAATLSSGLTNPQSIWFYFTTGDDVLDRDDEVRLWMAKSHLRIHNIMNNSNYHSEKSEYYLDFGAIGNAILSIEEDPDFIVRFAARNIREITFGEDYRGWVDTVDRTYQATARQLVQRFGYDKVGSKIRQLFDKGDDGKYECVHIVEPREDYGKIKGPKGRKFSSKYILVSEEKLLEEGGYEEFPYSVARFSKASGEIYGRGPGQTVLPDVKMLNQMKKTTIEGAQLTVRPPMVLPHDGFLLPLRLIPGGQNFAKPGRSGDDIKPLITNARIDFGFQAMEQIRKQIMEGYMVERLQLPQGPQMTATEVQSREAVMYRYMGPMLANLHHQDLRPTIDRVFGICLRKNILDRPPQILSNRKIDVHYSSPVARAQKLQDGQNILQAIQTVAPFAQADPTILDNFDGDEVVRHVSGIYGIPEQILRTQADVKKMRKARADQQAKMEQMQQAQATAQNVAAIGPTAVQAKKEGMI